MLLWWEESLWEGVCINLGDVFSPPQRAFQAPSSGQESCHPKVGEVIQPVYNLPSSQTVGGVTTSTAVVNGEGSQQPSSSTTNGAVPPPHGESEPSSSDAASEPDGKVGPQYPMEM